MTTIDLSRPDAWAPPGDTGHLRIYPAEPVAAKAARDFASSCAALRGFPHVVDAVREVTSELATNAMKHGVPPGEKGMFAVCCHSSRRVFFVDVIDRRAARRPVLRDIGGADDPPTNGMGMWIVDQMTAGWIHFSRRIGALDHVKVVRAAFM